MSIKKKPPEMVYRDEFYRLDSVVESYVILTSVVLLSVLPFVCFFGLEVKFSNYYHMLFTVSFVDRDDGEWTLIKRPKIYS